jgi:hypothetical protein
MSAEFDINKFHEREDFLVLLATPADRERVTSYFKAAGSTVGATHRAFDLWAADG